MVEPGRAPNLPTFPVWYSTLWKLFYEYPPENFQAIMRVSKGLANMLHNGLVNAGYFHDNMCNNELYRIPASYQINTALYFMSHGGELEIFAKAAHVSVSLINRWIHTFAAGIQAVYGDTYVRPSKGAADLATLQNAFCSRRGMKHVSLAIDGTHVPRKVSAVLVYTFPTHMKRLVCVRTVDIVHLVIRPLSVH